MYTHEVRAANRVVHVAVTLMLLLGAAAICQGADESISAKLKADEGVGVAFNNIRQGFFSVVVALTRPDEWFIVTTDQSSRVVDKSGETIWYRTSADEAEHEWEGCGASCQSWPGVLFGGNLTRDGEGNGDPPSFDASVADIDMDVDALGRHQGGASGHWPPDYSLEEDQAKNSQASTGGLCLPASLVTGTLPDDLPPATAYKLLVVTLRPHWHGTAPTEDGCVGKLTFRFAGSGFALYELTGSDSGTRVTSNTVTPVPTAGFDRKKYAVLTNEHFTESGAIKATFEWYSKLQGGPHVAEDYVRLAPILVNLDIARLNGVTVPQPEKHTQGSITTIVQPSEDVNDAASLTLTSVQISPIDILDDSNNPNRVRLFLKKVVLDRSPGKIRILKNGVVWMSETDTSKELSKTNLSQSFSVQATYGGVVDLMLVAQIAGQTIASDRVRISAIPDAVPQPGRIVFVNPNANNHNAPYDDFVENASTSIGAALTTAAPGDNIVVAREYNYNFSNQLSFQTSSIVLAGLGGRFVPPPDPNPYPWETDEMDWAQRLPHLSGQGTTGILEYSEVTDVQIAGLVFTNAHATQGAACKFENSANVRILCCHFAANVAARAGGGIFFRFAHSSAVSGCLFTSNRQFRDAQSSLGGGALFLQGCNGTTVARCRFEGILFESNNYARYGGGGISLYACPNSTVLACYFTACAGNLGGAILVKDPLGQPQSRIINSVFVQNGYQGEGGAVFVLDASCLISGCVFSGNLASHGGAIACRGTDPLICPYTVTIDHSQFFGNVAGGSGGALAVVGTADDPPDSCDPPGYWGGMKVSIVSTEFEDNVARSRGGALFATGCATAVTITGPNTFFAGNGATGGFDSHTRGGAIAGCASSGVYLSSTPGSPIVFDGNECNINGGAIYHTTLGEGVYEHCVFINNTASGDGGAIHATCGGDVTLIDCIVGRSDKPNTAANGGGISASSASVRLEGSSVSTSVVAHNRAANDGGGVYAIKILDGDEAFWVALGCGTQGSTLNASRTSISFNEADGIGAGIYGRRAADLSLAGYTLRLTESLIQGNTAQLGINNTSADGLCVIHIPSLLFPLVEARSCTFAGHPSAAITLDRAGTREPPLIECSNVTDNDVGLTTHGSGVSVRYCTFDTNSRGPRKTHVLIRESGQSEYSQVNIRDSGFISSGTKCGFDIDTSDCSQLSVRRCNIVGFTEPVVTHLGAWVRSVVYLPQIRELDFLDCYWGAVSGPLDDSDDRAAGGDYNPGGTGSRVTDGVRYRQWRTSPVTW